MKKIVLTFVSFISVGFLLAETRLTTVQSGSVSASGGITSSASGITNLAGNYFQSNSTTHAWTRIGTNGHIQSVDVNGTYFRFYTNGIFSITQTNGNYLSGSNGNFNISGIFTGNGSGLTGIGGGPSSGGINLVQLSDGTGGFTNSPSLGWNVLGLGIGDGTANSMTMDFKRNNSSGDTAINYYNDMTPLWSSGLLGTALGANNDYTIYDVVNSLAALRAYSGGQVVIPNFKVGEAIVPNVPLTVSISSGGSDYAVDDVLTLIGGDSFCTVTVTSESAGVITGISAPSGGTGYSLDEYSVNGGTGSEAFFIIESLVQPLVLAEFNFNTGLAVVRTNLDVEGILTATNGLVSYATNIVVNANANGYTNTSGREMIANVKAATGSYVFYNRSGEFGQTVCGTSICTNTIIVAGDWVPIGMNCGIQILAGATGVRIDVIAR